LLKGFKLPIPQEVKTNRKAAKYFFILSPRSFLKTNNIKTTLARFLLE